MFSSCQGLPPLPIPPIRGLGIQESSGRSTLTEIALITRNRNRSQLQSGRYYGTSGCYYFKLRIRVKQSLDLPRRLNRPRFRLRGTVPELSTGFGPWYTGGIWSMMVNSAAGGPFLGTPRAERSSKALYSAGYTLRIAVVYGGRLLDGGRRSNHDE